jgi:uncharacterized protein with PIN domain
MTALYVETSALLAWLFGEPDAGAVRKAIDRADPVVTSVLTEIEAERAIARAEHASILNAREAQVARGALRRVLSGWMAMEITSTVRTRAAKGFPAEPVRTLDAIHLATALEFALVFPAISVLSHDQRVLANAESLGLAPAR